MEFLLSDDGAVELNGEDDEDTDEYLLECNTTLVDVKACIRERERGNQLFCCV